MFGFAGPCSSQILPDNTFKSFSYLSTDALVYLHEYRIVGVKLLFRALKHTNKTLSQLNLGIVFTSWHFRRRTLFLRQSTDVVTALFLLRDGLHSMGLGAQKIATHLVLYYSSLYGDVISVIVLQLELIILTADNLRSDV